MKKFLIPLAGLIVGGIAGTALYLFIGNTSEVFVHYRTGEVVDASNKSRAEITGSSRVFISEGYVHDFGVMETNRVYEHEFIMENRGVAPLKIRAKRVTASSISTDLFSEAMVTIEPNGSIPIKLTCVARNSNGNFEEKLVLETNDPTAPSCELSVTGITNAVTESIPAEVDFGQTSYEKAQTFTFNAVSYKHDNLEIKDVEFRDKNHANLYSVKYDKLTGEQLGGIDGQPKSGYAVTVSMNSGHAIGWVEQEVQLKTNLPDYNSLAFKIKGQIIGDVTIRCEKLVFDQKRQLVELGVLRPGEPQQIDLTLRVQGDQARNFKAELLEDLSTPNGIYEVTVGTATMTSDTLAVVPLTVVVKPLGKRINMLGPTLDQYGRLVIGTNAKNAPKVLILISFEQKGDW